MPVRSAALDVHALQLFKSGPTAHSLVIKYA